MRPEPDPSTKSWEDILTLVAETQDQDAFAQLFRHFAPRVKAYALRGGASHSVAEEIAQETLAMAWRKAGLYNRDKAMVSTWLFAIARNLRIDRIRRERRPEPDPTDPSFAPEPPIAPDRAVTALQNSVVVRRALDELPAAQREAVMLSFFEEEPHSVIAERLDVPLGTVKSRIRLALRRMGETLNRDAHGVRE